MPSSSKTARIGSLARKHTKYDVWSLGDDGNDLVGAEESKNFSCILPRKKKDGKLYIGTLPVESQGVVTLTRDVIYQLRKLQLAISFFPLILTLRAP